MPDEHCRTFLDNIPFIGLAMAKGQMVQTPLMTRLIETLIMSAVAGGFATYVGLKVLEQDMYSIKQSIIKIESSVDKIDQKIEKVRGDMYVPRGTNAKVQEILHESTRVAG
jgi:rRNA processing protein Krr1/Pno1